MMSRLAEFHAAYLFDELTPAEVMRTRRHLAGIWYDEPDSQYGRPARFYHQLQRLDLASAWGRVRVPTLVVWGEYDWIMDRADQEQIVRLVNGNGNALASLLVVPGADHGFATHPDPQAAFDHMGEGPYPAESADRILRFVRRVAKLD
jgi:pimeloyl-ACP methyl ester carboxylesterase